MDFQLFSPWTKLPTTGQNKDLCFVLFSRIKSIPTIEKSVTVNVQGVSTIAVNGKLIEIIEPGIEMAKDIKTFIENLKKFEAINLCYGGPEASKFPKFSKALCTVSDRGLLQHLQCSLIIEKPSKIMCCIKCKSLINILKCRERRKTLGSKELIEVSPTKKNKINEIRKKTYSLQRTVVRTKKKITKLQEE